MGGGGFCLGSPGRRRMSGLATSTGLFILVEAMKRANSTDPQKIRDEIEKTKGFVGTGGIVSMSGTDHLGLDLSAFRMLEIKGGDWNLAASGS